ncbi:ribbon-helix-helix protein, CopG family [Candidatus Daviesbacteria bacterium]|nr:ribbon-helix-helix protein, CopG family [Candidatus Daviesbacteria bacterium]
MKKTKEVPKFKSIQEMADFWDTHSTADYPDFWQPAPDVKFSKNLVSVYKKVVPIRLDEKTKKAIEKVADAKGIGISTAARMLIRERLAELNMI